MSNRVLFVYDNLKVTMSPGDAPYPGFELLAGEMQCSVQGTLYDLGYNAGYHPVGTTNVRGQIWTTHNSTLVKDMYEILYSQGNVQLLSANVTITEDKEKMVVPAMIFSLHAVPDQVKIVDSGYWLVRGYKFK